MSAGIIEIQPRIDTFRWTLICQNSVIVDFSPDGKILASVSNDNTIALWDTENQQLLGEIEDADTIFTERLIIK